MQEGARRVRSKVIWLLSILFFISLFYTLVMTLADTLLLSRTALSRLPVLLPLYYIIIAALTLCVTLIVDQALKSNKRSSVFLLYLFFWVCFTGLFGYMAYQTKNSLSLLLVAAIFEVAAMTAVALFYNFISDYFHSREARHHLGYVHAGFPLGTVVMGLLVHPLVANVPMPWLFFMASLFLLVSIIFTVSFIGQFLPEKQEEETSTKVSHVPLKAIFKNKFILTIFAMIVFDFLYFVLIDYEWKRQAAMQLDELSLALFFGRVYALVGLIQLLVQFSFVQIALRHFGLIRSLAVNPVLAALSMVITSIFHGLGSYTMANVARYSFSDTLDFPARELLYYPLPERLRLRVQTIATVLIGALAQGIGGALLLFLLFFPANPLVIPLAASVLAIAWLISVFVLNRGYQKSLEASLEKLEFNPDTLGNYLLSSKGKKSLQYLIHEERYDEAALLLSYLPKEQTVHFAKLAESLIPLEKPHITEVALSVLKNSGVIFNASLLEKELLKTNEDHVALVLKSFFQVDPLAARTWILQFMNSPARRLKVQAYALALSSEDEKIKGMASTYLDHCLKAEGEAVEIGLEILGEMQSLDYRDQLRPIANDSEIHVRRHFISALKRIRDPEYVPELLRMFQDGSLHHQAREALEVYPLESVQGILRFLEESHGGFYERLAALQLLKHHAGRDTLLFLTAKLRETGDRTWLSHYLEILVHTLNEFDMQFEIDIDFLLQNCFEFSGFFLYQFKRWQRTNDEQAGHYQEAFAQELGIALNLIAIKYNPGKVASIRQRLSRKVKIERSNALELLELLLDRKDKERFLMFFVSHYLEQSPPVINTADVQRPDFKKDPWLDCLHEYSLYLSSEEKTMKDEQKQNVVAQMSKVSFLKEVALFSSIPGNYLLRIAEMLKHESYFKDETLFERGEEGDAMYIIQKGKVEVRLENAELILERGESLGEMSLVDGEPRSATCTVLDDCTVFKLLKRDFDYLLSAYPSISKSLLRILSLRLRESNLRA